MNVRALTSRISNERGQAAIEFALVLPLLVAVLFLIVKPHLFSTHGSLGADLGSPADSSENFDARPEWYFLFLFQFLKYFPGTTEIWGAIIIPSLVMLLIFLMPFLGRWRLGHRFNVGFLICLLAGAGLLTYLAKAEDRRNERYLAGLKMADRDAERERAKSRVGNQRREMHPERVIPICVR